jgi:Arc/MetJ family transcription regulator
MTTHKTAIMIDDELVAAAREALGTKGLTATVDAALRFVLDAERRRRHVERLRAGPGDLGDSDVMHRAWEHR